VTYIYYKSFVYFFFVRDNVFAKQMW